MKSRFLLIALLLSVATFHRTLAENPPVDTSSQDREAAETTNERDSAAPQRDLTAVDSNLNFHYSVWDVGKDLLSDQRAIWTSPFSVDRGDTRWLAPLVISAAALKPMDRRTSASLRHQSLEKPSKIVSAFGGPTAFAAAGGLYGIGKLAGKEKLRETGLLALRAVTGASLTTMALKEATNRQRPLHGDRDGSFWEGGRSFPSGHASETWALATVIAGQYPEKRWVQVAAYGVAAGVSASRLTGQKHFPTDILVGSAIGYLIGRWVVKSRQKQIQQLRLEVRTTSP